MEESILKDTRQILKENESKQGKGSLKTKKRKKKAASLEIAEDENSHSESSDEFDPSVQSAESELVQETDGENINPQCNTAKENGEANEDPEILKLYQQFCASSKEIPVILGHHEIYFGKSLKLKEKKNGTNYINFYCKVCKFSFDSLLMVNNHMKDRHHIAKLQLKRNLLTTVLLPPLPLSFSHIISEHLEEIISKFEMNEQDLHKRNCVVKALNNILQSIIPACYVGTRGSSFHKMGLNSSDLNLTLIVEHDMSPSIALSRLADELTSQRMFYNLEKNFKDEQPYISFNLQSSKLSTICKVGLNNRDGVALSRLLLHYSTFDSRLRKLCILFRLWGSICLVDKQEDGTWPSYMIYILVIYFLQQLRTPVLPVVPDNKLREYKSEHYNTEELLFNSASWTSNNDSSLGELWLMLLRFYAVEYDGCKYKYVYITEHKPNIERGKIGKNRIAVVDPFNRKWLRTACNNVSDSFIANCLRTTYLYYAIPQTREGPIFGAVHPVLEPGEHSDDEVKNFFYLQNTLNSLIVKLLPFLDANYVLKFEDKKEDILDAVNKLNDGFFVNISQINLSGFEVFGTEKHLPSPFKYNNLLVFPKEAEYLLARINSENVFYEFTSANFTGGKNVPKGCILCFVEGHLISDCPEEVLPDLEDIPIIDDALISLQNRLCHDIYGFRLKEKDKEYRNKIVSDIEKFLCSTFPNVRLTLFGSSCNGFGLIHSDLDICMTLSGCTQRKRFSSPRFIERVWKILKSCPNLKNLLCISTAKVPIIKFTTSPSDLQGDISLFNILAQENTKLLKTYSEIDIRVKILVYMIKRFAKVCNIGDASKGSLSSYSYTLMVIFFLQRCWPPVLPVLQELNKGLKKVDDCNCYFFSDAKALPEIWPYHGRNNRDAGDLWIELLRFYTEKFDIENRVISIRTAMPLSKFRKMWIGRNIAIEDPFDVNRNVSSAVSRRMNIYIIKAFRKGRLHFTSKPPPEQENLELQHYYFNKNVLGNVEPPFDRGCHTCKSIGHQSRSCPERKNKETDCLVDNVHVKKKNVVREEKKNISKILPMVLSKKQKNVDIVISNDNIEKH